MTLHALATSRMGPIAASRKIAEDDTGWEGLVARMRRKEPAAFERALGLTRDAGWRLACSMVNDAHLAQDVLQEAWVVVVTRLDSLRDPLAFKSWFLNIVLNCCRAALRQRQRLPVAEPAETPGRGFEDQVAASISVSTALSHLTEIERTSILLRDYLQLSYDEMATVLGIPLGTVKSRLSEAHRKLLRNLKGDRP